MRSLSKFQMIIVPVLACIGSIVQAQSAQQAAVTLFQQLQSDRTSAQAADQLLKLGKSDPAVRAYLVAHLPSLIGAGPQGNAWVDAARLAGGLKIEEAAAFLVKYIEVTTGGGTLSLSAESNLRTSPAGLALVEIGDPAVPALDAVLQHGNLKERWRAAFALNLIGSAKAKDVLTKDAPQQSNDLQSFIGRATGEK